MSYNTPSEEKRTISIVNKKKKPRGTGVGDMEVFIFSGNLKHLEIFVSTDNGSAERAAFHGSRLPESTKRFRDSYP